MAQAVHLWLKANGADIAGESTISSLDREGTIECMEFEAGVDTARSAATGEATGRRQHQPLKILKRIDKATPEIAKALCTNAVIEAVFRFYRPSPAGDGTTEQYFSVELAGGRVNSAKLVLPNTMEPASSSDPPLEEVTFVFEKISWRDEINSKEHEDSWSASA